MTVLYPSGYGTSMVTMTQLQARHLNHLHPEMARRVFPWIESRGGAIGIGSGFRTTQPDRPGFAPAGKSFHQEQTFASGFKGYCAFDLVHVNPGQVHRAPKWSEVPAQGSKAAATWRVHCNVSTEAWHMQPIEIDGYDSWLAAGRPDPVDTSPVPQPPVSELDDMALITRDPRNQDIWIVSSDLSTKMWVVQAVHDNLVATGLYKPVVLDAATLDRIPDARTLVAPI
jgi:hypothetical protein